MTQETQVRSLGQEDPLEEKIATHPSASQLLAFSPGKDPEIPVPPGDEHYVLDTSLDKVSFALQ